MSCAIIYLEVDQVALVRLPITFCITVDDFNRGNSHVRFLLTGNFFVCVKIYKYNYIGISLVLVYCLLNNILDSSQISRATTIKQYFA